jgi:hypothetical protein
MVASRLGPGGITLVVPFDDVGVASIVRVVLFLTAVPPPRIVIGDDLDQELRRPDVAVYRLGLLLDEHRIHGRHLLPDPVLRDGDLLLQDSRARLDHVGQFFAT